MPFTDDAIANKTSTGNFPATFDPRAVPQFQGVKGCEGEMGRVEVGKGDGWRVLEGPGGSGQNMMII